MFRQITNHKRTATVSGNVVTIMFDDGWEEILDSRQTVSSEAEGRALLLRIGFEEFDPNAHLKAAGFVWRDGCYRRPLNAEA